MDMVEGRFTPHDGDQRFIGRAFQRLFPGSGAEETVKGHDHERHIHLAHDDGGITDAEDGRGVRRGRHDASSMPSLEGGNNMEKLLLP